MKQRYGITIFASYIGYIVQAIVNNLSPLLYVQFSQEFTFKPWQITMLIIINFGVQIIMDAFSAPLVIKFGTRKTCIISHILTLIGLLSLGTLPYLLSPLLGVIIATLFLAIGGGFIELIVSPMIDALPISNRSGAMQLLHSFYCWGHILTILLSTLFFETIGIANWRYLPFIFTIFSILNLVLFSFCPIANQKGDEDKTNSYRKVLSFKGFFILLFIIFAGACSEIAIAEWGSYFVELRLNITSKTVGDLLGTCLFAFGMASSRTLYGFIGDKINLKYLLTISSVLLVIMYILIGFVPNPYVSLAGIALAGFFVANIWPGIYSIAAKMFPNGGTRMFALLALAGDVGCVAGPTVAGLASGDIKVGLAISTIFPIIAFIGLIILSIFKFNKNDEVTNNG